MELKLLLIGYEHGRTNDIGRQNIAGKLNALITHAEQLGQGMG